MRRVRAEWLLLPVFALPILLAAAALIVVHSEREGVRRSIRTGGADAARRWLDEEPGNVAWLRTRFDQAVARAVDVTPSVEFRRGDVTGRVLLTDAAGPPGPTVRWVIAPSFPGGLRASALQDASARIALETGGTIAQSVGADTQTVAFASFVRAPTVAALRLAPLPATTKRYLLGRCSDATPEDADALALLCDAESALDGTTGPLEPGIHTSGASSLLVATTDARVFVTRLSAVTRVVPDLVVGEDPSSVAVLAWSAAPRAEASPALWSDALAAPLAGHWSIVERDDAGWIGGTARERWALAIAVACLAFLLVPTALLMSLRKRRTLDEARARFVNEIAHDLRTPVSALRLHADLLASGRVPIAERKKHEDVIGREAARLTSLLANLLDLSPLERGTRPFAQAQVEFADVVLDSVREFAAIHPQRANDVTVSCPADLTVVADRSAVARILANLLDNAGKFTAMGTAIRVRVEAWDGVGARIVVEDDGDGIAESERARVFRVYERGSAAAKTAAPGTGLGLALVRDLSAGMGGDAGLIPTTHGAAFEVRLPGVRRE